MDLIDKERIEKEGEVYSNRVLDTRKKAGAFNGYTAGARAEHERMAELLKQERNRVVDDILNALDKMADAKFDRSELELLKLKSE